MARGSGCTVLGGVEDVAEKGFEDGRAAADETGVDLDHSVKEEMVMDQPSERDGGGGERQVVG